MQTWKIYIQKKSFFWIYIIFAWLTTFVKLINWLSLNGSRHKYRMPHLISYWVILIMASHTCLSAPWLNEITLPMDYYSGVRLSLRTRTMVPILIFRPRMLDHLLRSCNRPRYSQLHRHHKCRDTYVTLLHLERLFGGVAVSSFLDNEHRELPIRKCSEVIRYRMDRRK